MLSRGAADDYSRLGKSPIPDKGRVMPSPPSTKDDAAVNDVMDFRRGLLESPEVQQRFDQLVALHPRYRGTFEERFERLADPTAAQDPHELHAAGVVYHDALLALADDLEDAWALDEIEDIATKWRTPLADRRREAGVAPVGASLGATCGRVGRGRRMTPERIARATRAVALRAAGHSAIAADEIVSQETGYSTTVITQDRWQLRHRLDGPSSAERAA